jgi:hypothetical protein
MAPREMNRLLNHLCQTALRDDRTRLSDGQLLRWFRDAHDQAAF